MASTRYILVDEDFQTQLLAEIRQLKELVQKNQSTITKPASDELMDVQAVLDYLKITRRTLYSYRKKGLPTAKNEFGKLLFWKRDLDKFFGKENQ